MKSFGLSSGGELKSLEQLANLSLLGKMARMCVCVCVCVCIETDDCRDIYPCLMMSKFWG